jgi:hypothetical protein
MFLNNLQLQKIRFLINRRGIAFFAPMIAIMRMIKQLRLNFVHQIHEIWRNGFRRHNQAEINWITMDEFLDQEFPGLREKIEITHKAEHEVFLKSLKPRSPRPTEIRTMVIPDHYQDLQISWYINFKKRELLIFTRSCWPPALVDFMIALPVKDERLRAAGIFSPLEIEAYFKIKVCLEYGEKEKWFCAHVTMFYDDLNITKETLPIKPRHLSGGDFSNGRISNQQL